MTSSELTASSFMGRISERPFPVSHSDPFGLKKVTLSKLSVSMWSSTLVIHQSPSDETTRKSPMRIVRMSTWTNDDGTTIHFWLGKVWLESLVRKSPSVFQELTQG